MISDTILLWMNPKYTSGPTVYRSLDLQFHEDDPTSLQTSHDPKQSHYLPQPPVCFCHWPHKCFCDLSSWSLGHLRLPPFPLSSVSASHTPRKFLLHGHIVFYQILIVTIPAHDFMTSWMHAFSARNCTRRFISLKVLSDPITLLLTNIWWLSAAPGIKSESHSLAFRVLYHWVHAKHFSRPPWVLPKLCPMLQRNLNGCFPSACTAVLFFHHRPCQRLSPPGSLPFLT